jgi:hypothetical protein
MLHTTASGLFMGFGELMQLKWYFCSTLFFWFLFRKGDFIMSRTLDCVHSSMQPMFPYFKRFNSGSYEPNARLKHYESLEKKRYDRLGLQRLPTCIRSVTRIYNERYGGW